MRPKRASKEQRIRIITAQRGMIMDIYRIGRYIILGALLVTVLVAWPGLSAATSLITNGGFTASTPLDGWTRDPSSAVVNQAAGGFAVIGGALGRNSLVQDVTNSLPLV